jgi:hypothetical protein
MQTAPWPACGELDIMEAINDCAAANQTAHGPDGTNGRPWHQPLAIAPVGSGFHVYAAAWSPARCQYPSTRRSPADVHELYTINHAQIASIRR